MSHDEVLDFFAKYIETELGIIYSEHNRFQLQNRLDEIVKFMGLRGPEDLFKLGRGGIDGQFKDLLLDVATNNETSFFRDPKLFRLLEEKVLPTLPSLLSPGHTFRVWSAASSSGQEALSLAILVREYCDKMKEMIDLKILASDISTRMLQKARAGVYSQLEVQRGLPASYLVKYFHKDEENRWGASPEIKNMIDYQKLNLKSAFNFSEKFHLILCRNFLIYQNVEGKKAILNKIVEALDPKGYLVLGAGESLIGLSNDFEQISSDGAIVYRKKEQKLSFTA